jgi:acyl-CoA thioester hydrolase
MHYIEALPADARRLHSARYSMRWVDMDAFGHVNNATYFTYFEQVRIDWLAALGEVHEMVLANVSCTFLKPLVYPGDIEVTLYAGRIGRTSMDSYYEIRRVAHPGELYTLGHGTIVWFDHSAGSSIEIPAAVRRQLADAGADTG